MQRIYLDYNATTPLCEEALEAYRAAAVRCGNPSSVHLDGQSARHRLEEAREGLARIFRSSPQEILFTSGATEANNLAVKGLARHAAREGKKHLLVSAAEHASVLDAALALAVEGFAVELVPVGGDGRVRAEEVARRIRPETALVAVMAANNETGAIQPMEPVARVCADRGVPLHTDWVQGLGKLPVDLSGSATASFSAHKCYGPKGVGVLYAARRTRIAALVHGGPQENNVRAGTESPELALAMLAGVRFAEEKREPNAGRYASLRERFVNELRSSASGWTLNTDPSHTLAQTLNLRFEGVDGGALVTAMDLAGFSLSSGSACAAGSLEASHVLTAMGLAAEAARGALRISFGHFTTEEELVRCARALGRESSRLRLART